MNRKTHIALILAFVFFNSCSLKPVSKTNGILNLGEKQKLLVVGLANKNDVIKNLGEAILVDYDEKNNWVYMETEEVKNIYGWKKIKKNNILFVKFDTKGVLASKRMLDLTNMKNLNFDESFTVTEGVDPSFSRKLLSSLRKRMQNKMKNN